MNSPGFVFPRQCSQYIGMGADLCRHCQDVRDVSSESDRVLHQDITRSSFDGPAEAPDMPEKRQVAVLTVNVALYRLSDSEAGIKPAAMAGHSLGAYGALTAAGAMDDTDALTLVKTRGRYHHPQSRSRRGPFQRNHEGAPDTTAPFSRQMERDNRKNGPDGDRHPSRRGTEKVLCGLMQRIDRNLRIGPLSKRPLHH